MTSVLDSEKFTDHFLDTAEADQYRKCKSLYKRLVEALVPSTDDAQNESKLARPYSPSEIKAFQTISIAMVRYAPDPEQAAYHALTLTRMDSPLRDETAEIRMINSLMFVYVHRGDNSHMKHALDFVSIGCERGYYQEQPTCGEFPMLCRRFRELAQPILDFNRMQIYQEGHTIVKKLSNNSRGIVWDESFRYISLSRH